VNRWRLRMVELQRAGLGAPDPLFNVQNVQIVQNSQTNPTFEHFEQFEHRTDIVKETPRTKSGAVEAVPLSMPVSAWRAAVARLRPAPAIGDLSPQSWATFVSDCRSFVAGEWAVRAEALGWDARQLFGCHRDRPWIVNWWGALWFIHGGEILAMTEAMLLLKTIRGVRQSVRRPEIIGYDFIVPVWDVRV
jgi:hypothetical protein